jgi:hypothetical protein
VGGFVGFFVEPRDTFHAPLIAFLTPFRYFGDAAPPRDLTKAGAIVTRGVKKIKVKFWRKINLRVFGENFDEEKSEMVEKNFLRGF